MNSIIRAFRDKMVTEINNSGLPIEIVRLVLLEILNSLNAECDRIIAEEKAKAEKKKEEEE